MKRLMRHHLIRALFVLTTMLFAGVAMADATTGIKPFERGSWQAIRQAHAGRPTLVHFWGVTCGPCKVELPELGRFAKSHPGVDVVMIDADLVPNRPAAIAAMLAGAGLASAENWTFGDSYVERLRFEIDPKWQGEIPRTILIGKDGAIRTIEGSTEPADLDKWAQGEGAGRR
jgi:thiol-disulfide isomerase/thioredoxin